MSTTAQTAAPPANGRYTRVAVWLHWLIAGLIIAQLIGGKVMTSLPNTAAFKFEAYQMHKSFGLIVLALSLARLAWRLTHRPPAPMAEHAAWERVLARVTHLAFYGLMIGVPLAGWALTSKSPLPSEFLLLFDIPRLPVFGTAEGWAQAHEVLAFATGGLLALHVAGALKHHYADRDGTLARMAPWVRGRDRTARMGTLR